MKLTAIRLDGELLERVDTLAENLKRKRSSVIRELIERGLDSITDKPLSDNDWVCRLEFNDLLKRVEALESNPAKTAIATSQAPSKKSKPRSNNANQLKQIADLGCLNSTQLADRLNVDRTVLSRMNSDLDTNQFNRYCSERDPEGKAWKKLPDKIGRYAVYKPIQ